MPVHDVAAYILFRLGAMSAMKLQKLIYYCQAWSLARLDVPLFREDIQAWAHGPVVYELFCSHKGQYVVDHVDGDRHSLDVHQRRLVDDVLAHYGAMTAVQLRNLTHEEQPWLGARGGMPDDLRMSDVISHEAMRQFYRSQLGVDGSRP